MGARVGGDAELRVMSGTENTDSYVTVGTAPKGAAKSPSTARTRLHM